MSNVTAKLTGSLLASLVKSADITSIAATLTQPLATTFTNGSNAPNKVDQAYSEARELSGSEAHTFDLMTFNNGTDVVGSSINLATVKALSIFNLNGTESNSLRIGGALAGPSGWTVFNSGTLILPGNAGVVFVNPGQTGWPVNIGDLFKICNPNGTPVEYEVLVVGASA